MNALEKSVEIQLDNLFGGLSFAFPCLSRPDILTALRAFEEKQGNNKRGPAYTSPLNFSLASMNGLPGNVRHKNG